MTPTFPRDGVSGHAGAIQKRVSLRVVGVVMVVFFGWVGAWVVAANFSGVEITLG
jgi:uncharacterized membrane protein